MAIHKRIRQAGRKLLANVRKHGRGVRARLSRRPKDRKHARNPAIPGLDKQLSAVAAEVLAGRYVETPLELIRVVHLVGCSDEDVFRALGELCTQHGLAFTVHEHPVGRTTARFVVSPRALKVLTSLRPDSTSSPLRLL